VPRTLLILGMLVLSLGAAVTVLLWSPADGAPTAMPMMRLVPATPRDAEVSPTAASTQLAAAQGSTALLAREAAAADSDPENRNTVLSVQLVDDMDQPVPHHELGLAQLPDASSNPPLAFLLRQRTDGAGHLQFSILRPADARDQRVVLYSASLGWIEAILPDRLHLKLSLQLKPRCWVRGVVIAADGSPVAGATLVHVRPEPAGSLPSAIGEAAHGSTQASPPRELGRTDRLGRFRVALVQGGWLGAEHNQLAPSALQAVTVPDRHEPVRETEVQLQLLAVQGRIVGSSLSADGQPVAGVRLEFRALEAAGSRRPQRPPQVGVSDEHGRFAIANLVPGEVCWTAHAAGHGGTHGRLALQPGQTSELQIVLPPPASLHGSVRAADGTPVAGARLEATPETDTATGATWCDVSLACRTVSGPDGSFRMQDLPPGRLRVLATGTTTQPGTARTSMLLQAGQQQTWQPVLTEPKNMPWLRGQVVDATYRPCPGRTVVLLQGGSPPQMVRTDADGQFQFDLTSVAAARLMVLAPGASFRSFQAAQLQVPSPAMAEVQLVLDAEVERVRVVGVVQSQNQEPLPATISVWHAGLQRAAQVTADATGKFELEAVPIGQIEVTVSHPGHATSAPMRVAIRGGNDVDLGTISLGVAGAIHGSVQGADGQVPTSLEVFVVTNGDDLVPGEYAGGQYRINLLPAGRHWLHVQGPNVAAASFAIDIQAGVEVQQDMRLLAGLRRPFIVEADAAAGARLSLALRRPGEREQWLAQSARAANGSVSFVVWLAPGSYEAIAFSSEGWRANTSVTIAPGDESTVRLVLQRH